jgi:ubiquinone/menaquinone biosynthesis C-methylase UbiE
VKENREVMIKKYRFFSVFYDNAFRLLEKLVFLNRKNNPRLALAGRIPDEKLEILDVCCGSGNGALGVARSNHSITGVDVSPDMLALARRKTRKLGLGNVRFLEMDAGKMSFTDNSFDIAMCWFGLHEMEYDLMMYILKDVNRVLKKGGRLYIIDYEDDVNLVRQFLFRIYLRICYPEHVQEFIKYDWNSILEETGYRLDYTQRYTISRLTCAVKRA